MRRHTHGVQKKPKQTQAPGRFRAASVGLHQYVFYLFLYSPPQGFSLQTAMGILFHILFAGSFVVWKLNVVYGFSGNFIMEVIIFFPLRGCRYSLGWFQQGILLATISLSKDSFHLISSMSQ